MMATHVLAGDIGGTKTLLALVRVEHGVLSIAREQRFDTGAFPGLTPMVKAFLGGDQVGAACFGVAAPITGRTLRLTNRDFVVDADALEAQGGVGRVALLNDFAVIAYGLDALPDDAFQVLQQGVAQAGKPRVLIGAGTGLGQAILAWRGDGYEVLSTEGGHVDFAAQDDEQIALWHTLGQKYGHVSYERVLSGAGLVDLFQFVAAQRGVRPTLAGDDAAAEISASALAGNDDVARDALRLFVRIYGQQAGNLALTTLAQGGVYIAGGIAPKIIEFMQQGEFMAAFCAKGRYHALLSAIPVKVVMNPKVGLLGAALFASRLSPT